RMWRLAKRASEASAEPRAGTAGVRESARADEPERTAGGDSQSERGAACGDGGGAGERKSRRA
ncbi:MAG: hypothetical protein IKF78_01090, partial [Atopobiaceae bacterium]|nr:hypothetical protein [Atopobiaceae bacterium]